VIGTTSSGPRRLATSRGFTLLQLVVVIAVMGVLAGMAVPATSQLIGNLRLSGDARGLTNTISLTKLRAASHFTKARLFVDLSGKSYRIETWQKSPGAWVTEASDGLTYLSSNGESYSFGVVSTPPPNSQATIAQSPACLTAAGATIGNTACVVFNSRGIPVTDVVGGTGGPTNVHALYLTDGTAVFGVTVSATSVIQLWRTFPLATPNWQMQ
jgi:Tfp pilus assembly protein FimT